MQGDFHQWEYIQADQCHDRENDKQVQKQRSRRLRTFTCDIQCVERQELEVNVSNRWRREVQ